MSRFTREQAAKDAMKAMECAKLRRINAALLAACKEGRDVAAALMRAIHASGYGLEVMDEMEPGYDGFGVRMQKAIAEAEA